MCSRTGSPRILSWRITFPQKSLLPVPPLAKGNEDSGNAIVKSGKKFAQLVWVLHLISHWLRSGRSIFVACQQLKSKL